MTPQEIMTTARRRYNAVGDSFFSDAEIYDLIYAGELELAREAFIIENSYSVTTVAGTQEYAYPANAIAIRRVVYDGKKLKPISFREDDAATGNDADTTNQGRPCFYYQFAQSIFLRPIPDNTLTLTVYTYDEPGQVTGAAYPLEVPSQWHMGLVNFVVAEMFGKDQNQAMMNYYNNKWEKTKQDAIKFKARMKRTDANATVKDEESLAYSILGTT